MIFTKPASEVFVPDGSGPYPALAKTTDLCIAAHQDDIEIMAYAPIAACFRSSERSFTGCVLSDGRGSPRNGVYAGYTDEQMTRVRITEQKNAARIGGYGAQVFLGYTSAELKDTHGGTVVDDIALLLRLTLPQFLYTHNLADKHHTHVAAALRVIEAARRLPDGKRPIRVYSMEAWRGLDWLCDGDKTAFDVSAHPNLAAALLGVFDSQIAGGKRYDSAALGRRLANATFSEIQDIDSHSALSYALDITELVYDASLDPADFIMRYIDNFSAEVIKTVEKYIGA